MPPCDKKMNRFASLIFPAILGLVAGVGHGVLSHHAGLPVSLTEQFLPPIALGQSLQN